MIRGGTTTIYYNFFGFPEVLCLCVCDILRPKISTDNSTIERKTILICNLRTYTSGQISPHKLYKLNHDHII